MWLDRYGDDLYYFALMRMRDESLSEDLVQETLLAAIGAQSSYRGQSSEKTWLIGILGMELPAIDEIWEGGLEDRVLCDRARLKNLQI